MTTTNYVVQLYSEEEPQHISSVSEVKQVGDSVFIHGEDGQLFAVYEASDIQKLAPLSQNQD